MKDLKDLEVLRVLCQGQTEGFRVDLLQIDL